MSTTITLRTDLSDLEAISTPPGCEDTTCALLLGGMLGYHVLRCGHVVREYQGSGCGFTCLGAPSALFDGNADSIAAKGPHHFPCPLCQADPNEIMPRPVEATLVTGKLYELSLPAWVLCPAPQPPRSVCANPCRVRKAAKVRKPTRAVIEQTLLRMQKAGLGKRNLMRLPDAYYARPKLTKENSVKRTDKSDTATSECSSPARDRETLCQATLQADPSMHKSLLLVQRHLCNSYDDHSDDVSVKTNDELVDDFVAFEGPYSESPAHSGAEAE